MVTSFKFSEKRIQNLAPPEIKPGKKYEQEFHRDEGFPGLQVCVTSTGTRTFYFSKRIDGKPTRIKLGTIQELSVEDAPRRRAACRHRGRR